MNSSTSRTCVHDASLLSRRPRLAEIDNPEAQMPGNPASSTILADNPLCASMRKVRNGELISARKAAAPTRRARSGARIGVVGDTGNRDTIDSRTVFARNRNRLRRSVHAGGPPSVV
jgi:hypothetical protein